MAHHRSEQRTAVRGVADRAVVDLPDTGPAEGREPFHDPQQVGLQALRIRRQQLLPEVAGNAVHGPETGVGFVDAAEEAAAFLPDLGRSPGVAQRRHLEVERPQLGNAPGDHLVVLQCVEGEIQVQLPGQFPRPEAARDHQVLRADPALGGGDLPGAGRPPQAFGRAAPPGDPRASGAGRCGKGVASARDVDVAVPGGVRRPKEAGGVEQGVERPDLRGLDDPVRHAEFLEHGGEAPAGVELLPGRREPEATGGVEPHGAPRFPVRPETGPDRVHVEAGDARVVPEEGHVPRRVPGRSEARFPAFQEQDLAPAAFGQPVEDAAPDDSAADDGDPDPLRHRDAPRRHTGSRWMTKPSRMRASVSASIVTG